MDRLNQFQYLTRLKGASRGDLHVPVHNNLYETSSLVHKHHIEIGL